MNDYIPVLIALIAGPAVAVVTAVLSRPKVRSDATKTLTDISLSLVRPQMERIETLERKYADLDIKYRRMERWVHALAAQVIETGNTPVRWEDIQ